jgi:Na+/phosphate symporter
MMMDEKERMKITGDVLTSLITILDGLKHCLFSGDGRKLKDIEKSIAATTMSSLPLFEELVRKKQKTAVDEKLLGSLPSLQQLGIGAADLASAVRTAIEARVPFTDKALTEISEIMALTKDLTRDTNDVISTGNARFRAYVLSSAANLRNRVDEYGLAHRQRLLSGLCTPKSSFVYLDIMQALRRIAREPAALCEKV